MTLDPSIADGAQLMDIMQIQATLAGYSLVDPANHCQVTAASGLAVDVLSDQAQLTFDVDGSLFALDAILHAGWDAVQFDIPAGESGPIPTALEDWLRPVASESVVDPQSEKGLVSRDEVSK